MRARCKARRCRGRRTAIGITGGRSGRNKVKRLGATSNVDIISGRGRSAPRVYKFVKPGAGPLNAEWH